MLEGPGRARKPRARTSLGGALGPIDFSSFAESPSLLGLVSPCGAKPKHRDPGLGRLAALNTVALHAGAAVPFTARRIRPDERKSKPQPCRGRTIESCPT